MRLQFGHQLSNPFSNNWVVAIVTGGNHYSGNKFRTTIVAVD